VAQGKWALKINKINLALFKKWWYIKDTQERTP
jgi:hypothetical protein